MKVRNKFDGCDYLLSVVRVRKRITISRDFNGVPFPPMKLEHITLQGAIYEHRPASFLRQVFSKPVLVVNLEDRLGRVAREDFENLLEALIADESIPDLLDEERSYQIYRKYGFESATKAIWSLFLLSRIGNAFIFQAP
jgi:hypothetical protein